LQARRQEGKKARRQEGKKVTQYGIKPKVPIAILGSLLGKPLRNFINVLDHKITKLLFLQLKINHVLLSLMLY
jgi:hypothetical protein